MKSKCDEGLTGVVNALEVVYRVGHSPAEPEGYTTVYVRDVNLEFVREVAVEVVDAEVLINV